MDRKKSKEGLEEVYRLMALCARVEWHDAFYKQLTDQMLGFDSWDILPEQAEIHGMAPLLWHHLKKAEIPIPDETAQILKGLYLRHRYFNQFHTDSLLALTTLLGKENIHPLVLKGLSLAHTCYPDPALRPMSDVDLLLPTQDVLPALEIMQEAGYSLTLPPAGEIPRELIAESPRRNNMSTHIELHHYSPTFRTALDNTPDTEFKGFLKAPQKINIQGVIILAPNLLEHFHYLWRHLTRHIFPATSQRPMQFKWVADIIAFVEHYAEEIDWEKLKHEHPDILARLDVFYNLSPMPPQYKEIIPIKEIRPLKNLHSYPLGWPQHPYRKGNLWQIIIYTLTPPANWWVKLYYGIEDCALFWYRHIVYKAKLLHIFFLRLIKKIFG